MADSTFTDVVKKGGQEDAELDADAKRMAGLEAELNVAQSRIDLAEMRYQNACRQAEAELAKPDIKAQPRLSGDNLGLAEVEAKLPSDGIAAPDRAKGGAKNTSARSEKELSSERWIANKAAEGRVREKAKKAKQCLRRAARDKRTFISEAPEGVEEAAPAPAKPAAPAAPEKTPLYDSDEVKAGAKGIADRLPGLMGRPNVVEKRASLLMVLIGGRENYYIAEPTEVLNDLKERGLVETGLAAALLDLLKVDEVPRSAPVPPEEWLAHAKKMGDVDRKDDKPFSTSEGMYLKWVDRKNFSAAEAELDASQMELEELLRQVELSIPAAAEDATEKKAISAEQAVDLDYAQYLEEVNDPERQSKGMKNTSALTEKVLSKEKWLAARGEEERSREKGKIAREARRGEARDTKTAAADVQ